MYWKKKKSNTVHETLVYYICWYLFAKGVEGVILWGIAPNRKISIHFHPRHLVDGVQTEVAPHLHKTVIESMSIGESLFKAHQAFVIECQKKKMVAYLLMEIEEIKKTLKWIARFGIGYALFHNYQSLSKLSSERKTR